MAADHVGTGRAFGLAAGAFQTAWEAPVSGRYRLSSSYTRYADILYDLPDDGDVSASFDTSLLAVSHETGEVNSRRTHPELQHKNGRLRRELAEWFLEVGVTYLVATTFGLGLVARVVLAQVMNNLIELNQSVGSGGSDICDVYHRVQPNRGDPIELTVEFDASEGEVFVFELSPSLEFGFELRNSWWYQPTSVGSAEWRSFCIERIG